MTYRMENGHTTLSLAEIYRQVPSIFSAEVKAEDNLEVRFPWQKLRDLIRLSGASVEGSSLVGAKSFGVGSHRPSRRKLHRRRQILRSRKKLASQSSGDAPAFSNPSGRQNLHHASNNPLRQ